MRKITVCEYADLNDDAKEVALSEVVFNDVFGGKLNDDLKNVLSNKLRALGIEDLELEFDLTYSQGSGVAFYGYIDNAHLWNWVDESKLSDDEVTLVNACVLGKCELDINIERNFLANRYSHCNTMDINIPSYYADAPFDDDKMEELIESLGVKILEQVREKSRALTSLGYEIIEEFNSKENIERLLDTYLIEFYEDGSLFD